MLPVVGALGRTKTEIFNALFEELTYAEKKEVPLFIIKLFFNSKTNILGDSTFNNIDFPAFLIKSVSATESYITIKLTNYMTIESREGSTNIYYDPPENLKIDL
ncbi:MAG: hypothetical protein ABIA91_02715 [Patescibacteria group bacterium]